MRPQSDALLERTRAVCIDRLKSVIGILTSVSGPDDSGLTVALRELHAVKGETSMARLRTLSQIAHAFETLLGQRRNEQPWYLDDIRAALEMLLEIVERTASSELDADPDIDDLLAELSASIAGGATDRVSAEQRATSIQATAPVGAAGNGTQGRSAWLHIDALKIDELCDQVSAVSSDLEQLREALFEVLGSPGIQQTLGPVQRLRDRVQTVRSKMVAVETTTWNLRLLAVEPMLQELSRHVSTLAGELGKNVSVEVRAGGVEVERAVLEALREPLMHVVRNAVDHGIEASSARGDKPPVGRIVLEAESHGSQVTIAVQDDGQGIDPQRLRQRAVALGIISAERARLMTGDETLELVFASGFTQKETVTELSGRGVGLAAARSKVEGMGGAFKLSTSIGNGTRFELILPTVVSRERVLLVESGQIAWALPARWIRAVIRNPDDLESARNQLLVRTKEGLLPVRSLASWLGVHDELESSLLVVEIAGLRRGVLVGRTLWETDLLRRPADAALSKATRASASGTLQDGRVVLFLRWAEVLRDSTPRASAGPRAPQRQRRTPRILVVDDSAIIRDIVGEILSGAGFEVLSADNGAQALAMIEEQHLDLVISDVEMPRMSGLEFLKELRKGNELLPVVMLTTRNSTEHRREAALLGANAYVAKSEFHGDTLLEVVGRFVGLPR